MNGEHLQDLRESHGRSRTDANGERDEFQARLSAVWAATALLAAYDHELFHPWRPGQESIWKATLDTLQAARSRVVAEVIPMRLRRLRELAA